MRIIAQKVSWVDGECHPTKTGEWSTDINCADPADAVKYMIGMEITIPSATEFDPEMCWRREPYRDAETNEWHQWTVRRGAGEEGAVTDDQWREVCQRMTDRAAQQPADKEGGN